MKIKIALLLNRKQVTEPKRKQMSRENNEAN
jgi:hypothetical protein